MKRQLKTFLFFAAIVLLMASCMPVNEALQNNSRQRTSQNRTKKPTSTSSSTSNRKKPSSSNNSSSSSSSSSSSNNKTNSKDAVYKDSKDYLKKRDTKLSLYCMDWVGTPHVLGGNTKQGVDCSGFVYNVYKDVFDITLPRRSADMENEVKILSNKTKMREGDLVFFGKNGVNHVGIFLNGDNFVHTSTSKGVIVSSLEEKYWKENFRSCGHHPKVNN
ncbi:MAG: C40 family peptidase [Bacteroidales bacterium]|nr:C40 family peptidase [Bacteroidales bacterium]